MSREGTARVLVLLGSGLLLAGATVVCTVALVVGPAFSTRSPLLGVAVYATVTLVSIVVANLLSIRARTTKSVVGGGCGTLLLGTVVAIGALLLLISG